MMKYLKVLRPLSLLIFTLVLISCGDDYYSDEYLKNSDEKLCNKTWVEESLTDEGEICKHQLKFAKKDNSGQEVWEYYRSGETRPHTTNSKSFTWKWIDSSMEGLILNYGVGEVKYFDNVWVREHYLSGKLDGTIVMMTDDKYK